MYNAKCTGLNELRFFCVCLCVFVDSILNIMPFFVMGTLADVGHMALDHIVHSLHSLLPPLLVLTMHSQGEPFLPPSQGDNKKIRTREEGKESEGEKELRGGLCRLISSHLQLILRPRYPVL